MARYPEDGASLEAMQKGLAGSEASALNCEVGAFAGEKMLLDHDYFRRTRELILGERDRMETELKKLPIFKVYPAYANFILLKIQKEGLTSADVFEACIKKGLMIRDCSSFQCLDGEFVRFCIMMPEDNTRLLDVLKQL